MNITKDSLVVFFSRVIVSFLFLLGGIILARNFGPNGKGVYEFFQAIIALIVTCGAFGIGTASIYLINRKKRNISQLLSNSLIFGLFGGIILSGLFYLATLLFPVLAKGLSKDYTFLLFLTIPFAFLHSLLLPFFLAKFRVIKWAFFSTLYAFLVFVGILISVFILNSGIKSVFYFILFDSILIFILILFSIFKLIDFKFNINKNLFKEEIKFGLKAYPWDIFNIVSLKLNLFLVNLLIGITSVGYYSVTLGVSSCLLFISFSFRQIFYPIWSSSEKELVDKVTPRITRQAFILGTIAGLFLLLSGKYFILFVYGDAFSYSVSSFYLILPGIVFMIPTSILFNNFFSQGRPQTASIIIVSLLIFNILLSLILIPMFGINGASISISVSYFFGFILSLFVFSKLSNHTLYNIIKIRKNDFAFLRNHFSQLFHI